jgi:AGZA family xanthine/uracil permease-like MFS transporter
MLARFELAQRGTTVRREIAAGATTFMTMAYILGVQPAVLGRTGMDPGAVLVATCLASGLATLLMGMLADYPVALAPAMGHNFFFVVTVCGAMGYSWQAALGANFVAGLAFVVLTLLGVQARLVAAIPPSLRHGIAAGIGLFIALIGLQWAGIIVSVEGGLVGLGDLGSRPVLVSLAVLALTCALLVRRIPGAILLGILGGVLLGVILDVTEFHGLLAAPPSLSPTLLQLDLRPLWTSADLWVAVLVFLFLDLFDTMGTLVGVSTQAGLMRGGELPRAREAFLSDAIGTVTGAGLGTTTVTSYIESATGIAAGGRTGLVALVVAGFFALSLFCYPLVRTIGEGYALPDGTVLYPLTAPALIVVGSFMMRSASEIAWDDPLAALPGFLTLITIPLTFSISDGIAFGFLAASFLSIARGRIASGDPVLHGVAVLFLLRWLLL